MKDTLRVAVRPLAWAIPIVASILGYAWWSAQSRQWVIEFHNMRWLLVLPIALVLWLVVVLLLRPLRAQPGDSSARLLFSRGTDLARIPRGWRARLTALPAGLRLAAIAVLAVALTRPQRVDEAETVELSGIDIVISLDLSGSMKGADLPPTRLEAAKLVINRFIEQRPTDRIGLVVFGREAFPALAPTLDHNALAQIVSEMRTDILNEESHAGTAIGDGLGAALTYLSRSNAQSKTVVLLTDGANNAGHLDPMHAAQLARAIHAKVYTILVGRQSQQVPVQVGTGFGGAVTQLMDFPIDPELLTKIAEATEGKFFRATDQASLDTSFRTILDNLQKSSISSRMQNHTELFPYLLIPAALLLAIEILLTTTLLRRFP